MQVQIDENYKISSDLNNFILQEKRVAKQGKNEGKEHWVDIGYFSKLQTVLEYYIQRCLRTSEIDTLTKLSKRMDELEEIIKKVK